MNRRTLIEVTAVAAVAGGAAYALYRATHPADARITVGSGRRVADDRYELPDGVVDHEIATRDGGTIHAIEKGEGRPLVLLHGITLRSDVWAPQFHDLADRYRVIAVDLRGHGTSVAGDGGFGLARLGDDLEDLLVGLDLHDAVVVGHSMGGMTLMNFCADHADALDERVAGVVFLNTRAHQVFPPGTTRALRSLVARGSGRVAAGRDLPGAQSAPTAVVRLAFGGRPNRRAVQLVADMGASMDAAAMLSSVDQLFDHDARVALGRTGTPSMVVVGTRDLLTPVPASRHLARLLPDSDFVVLRGAGHQMMQERPDELAELLDGFVERLTGRAASLSDAVAAGDGPVGVDQVVDAADTEG